jgi:uncharacterized repeat protein (TIGR01451 family)
MLNKRFGIRWLAWPAIAAIVVLIGLSVSSTPVAQGNGEDKMEVLPASQLVGLGAPFTVNIKGTTDEADFQGYEDAIYYPYPEVTTSTITQLQPAGMTTCGTMAITEPDPAYGSGTDTGSAYDYGCSAGAPVGTFAGNLTKFDMACGQTSGTYTLHIITMTDDPTYGSTLLNSAGAPITTTYYDATVQCAELSDLEITKSHSPEPMTVGLPATYTLTVHNIGPQAARGVVIADEVPLDKTVQGLVNVSGVDYLMPPAGGMDVDGDTIPDAACLWFALFPNPVPPYSPPVLQNVVLCYAAGAGGPLPNLPASGVVTVIIPVIPGVAGVNVNTATVVTFGPFLPFVPETEPTTDPNPENDQAVDEALVVAGVRMTKVPDLANLWLCKNVDPEDPNCDPANGEGSLVIDEDVTSISDPDGVGAFEFVVRWDHKVFDIDVAATDWLTAPDPTSGEPTRLVNCAITLIDENAVHFACVSKDPDWETDPGTPPTGALASGTIAVLSVTPAVDVWDILTPGQQNGITRTIIDDNCELADINGDPLSSGATDPDTGRELPLPGILPGGEVEVCTNATVTVRILEGDLNLDCVVNVLDDQAIAYRYGASFGMLLYTPWYDLEPALKDRDIDIKDVQKVFGRNGSTCDAPYPDQDPIPPVDP